MGEHDCQVPMAVWPVPGTSKSLVKGVRLIDELARFRGGGQQFDLTLVRREWFSLFDAELPQHRKEKAIPLFNWLGLIDRVQSLPVAKSTRLHARPWPAVGR